MLWSGWLLWEMLAGDLPCRVSAPAGRSLKSEVGSWRAEMRRPTCGLIFLSYSPMKLSVDFELWLFLKKEKQTKEHSFSRRREQYYFLSTSNHNISAFPTNGHLCCFVAANIALSTFSFYTYATGVDNNRKDIFWKKLSLEVLELGLRVNIEENFHYQC